MADYKRAPYVRIIEQPSSKGVRFRYECEGRCAGSLIGESSTMYERSYPTIKIENYKGPAYILVSCVSKDPPFYPHPHKLVGKSKEVSNGICYFKTESDDMVVTFMHLGIQCVTRKGIESSLAIRQQLHVDPFNAGFDQNPEKIDLYCVRLCFQVFVEGRVKGNFNVALAPVLSHQIYDKRMRVEPVISFISHKSASACGGTEICILCEKVIKDDIEVRFYRKENKWEAIAELTPPRVFKQVAIVFQSPIYIDQNINEPVKVKVQLRRISDGEVSDSVSFIMVPSEAYARQKSTKRKRSNGLTIADRIQAEVSKNKELINLAYPKAQDTEKVEPWELPPVKPIKPIKNKSVPSENKSKPFIPVVTLRNNEWDGIRNEPLKPRMLKNGCNTNIQSQPFDYSMKSSTSQKFQNSTVHQPPNKLQTYQNSSESIKSDSWLNEFIDAFDQKCSSPSRLPTTSKNTNNVIPESEARFAYFEKATQGHFFDVQEFDNLLGLEQEIDQNVNNFTPTSSSLSSLNISDLIKDIGNGMGGTNVDNVFQNIDNLPPVKEREYAKAQDINQPLEIPIEALKSPYFLM